MKRAVEDVISAHDVVVVLPEGKGGKGGKERDGLMGVVGEGVSLGNVERGEMVWRTVQQVVLVWMDGG